MNESRDYILLEDQFGNLEEYAVEALFDMNENSYALLRSGVEAILLEIQNEGEEQYFVGISGPSEYNSLLDAYSIAVNASFIEDGNGH